MGSYFYCRECGEELYLDDQWTSDSGKRIPIEVQSDEPHDCPYRDNSLPCRRCKKPIYFDSKIISSKSGKKISIDVETDEPHQCIVPPQQKRPATTTMII